MALLTALIALAGLYIPPLQFLSNLIWTVPIVIVIVRFDLRTGVLALMVAALLLGLTTGPVTALMLVVQFGALGLVYGYFFKIGLSSGFMILGGVITASLSLGATLLLSILFIGADPGAWVRELEVSFEGAMRMYEKMGLLPGLEKQGVSAGELRQSLLAVVEWIKLIVPSILVVSAGIGALVNFLVSRSLLMRVGLAVPHLPPYREWRLPWYYIWGVIAGLLLYLAGDYWALSRVRAMGINILYLYLPLLLVIGFSVVIYFWVRFRLPQLFKLLTVFIALVNLPLAILAIAVIGLFDPLFNYRRLADDDRGCGNHFGGRRGPE